MKIEVKCLCWMKFKYFTFHAFGAHFIYFRDCKDLPNLVETGREEGEVCGVPGQIVAHPRLAG